MPALNTVDVLVAQLLPKKLDDSALRLAVITHVRHAETNYDELLMGGWERFDARGMVKDQLKSVLSKWRTH
jgi:hypothetical protein